MNSEFSTDSPDQAPGGVRDIDKQVASARVEKRKSPTSGGIHADFVLRAPASRTNSGVRPEANPDQTGCRGPEGRKRHPFQAFEMRNRLKYRGSASSGRRGSFIALDMRKTPASAALPLCGGAIAEQSEETRLWALIILPTNALSAEPVSRSVRSRRFMKANPMSSNNRFAPTVAIATGSVPWTRSAGHIPNGSKEHDHDFPERRHVADR